MKFRHETHGRKPCKHAKKMVVRQTLFKYMKHVT